jgi:hypothetical protein
MTRLGTLVCQGRILCVSFHLGLCLQHAGCDSLKIGYQELDVFETGGKCYEAST